MKSMKLFVLLFVIFLIGNSEKQKIVAQETLQKNKLPEAPWKTPDKLALYLANTVGRLDHNATAQSNIAIALANAGDKKQAVILMEKTLKNIQESEYPGADDIRARAFTKIGLGQLEAGEKKLANTTLKLVLEIAQKKKNKAIRDLLAGEAISIFIKMGEIDQVMQFALKKENAKSRGVFATILADEGEIEQSLKLVKKVEAPSHQVFHLCQIIAKIAKTGNKKQVLTTQKLAIEIANKSSKPLWRVTALCRVASSMSQTGNKSEASMVMNQSLKEIDKIKNSNSKGFAISDIAVVLTKIGKIEQALALTEKIESKTSRGMAIKDIAIELAKAGKVENSLDILQKHTDEIDRKMAMSKIVKHLAETGKIKQAIAVEQKMSDDSFKVDALTGIALALARENKHVRGLKYAQSINYGMYKNYALEEMAIIAAKNGNFKQSIEEVKLLRRADLNSATLAKIALLLATEPLPNNKKYDPKYHIIRKMKNSFTPQEKQFAKQLFKLVQAN